MAMERWRPFGSVDPWEPFRNLVDIQGEVNRMLDTFVGRPMAGTLPRGTTRPRTRTSCTSSACMASSSG